VEPTLVTETSEVKTQTPGKFPEESTLVSQRGENLKTYKIYIKIDIKTAATCFGVVTPSSGRALFELAKVTVVKIIN
jgi:hypothetical protein